MPWPTTCIQESLRSGTVTLSVYFHNVLFAHLNVDFACNFFHVASICPFLIDRVHVLGSIDAIEFLYPIFLVSDSM